MLDIGLHGDQLLVPVGPRVCSVGREVKHPVASTVGRVGVPEGLVGAQGEAFQELRRYVVAAEVAGCAVTAVHPDPGVVGDQAGNLNHWVVALPGRVAGRTPHAVGVVTARVVHRQADQRRPPALGRVEEARQRRGVRELLRVVRGQDQRGTARHRKTHRRVACRGHALVGL
ncbi:Uncharacterised protein [Mycobacterium tuberculosis]|uniref:Uncharacterized protein n=1 Tax=Mycobacterium tuberculosis TaxID=1773 RepID=A0A916LA67_MYCTX|nr:Uncharacterised protein [Mycobacterium tuberculosis]